MCVFQCAYCFFLTMLCSFVRHYYISHSKTMGIILLLYMQPLQAAGISSHSATEAVIWWWGQAHSQCPRGAGWGRGQGFVQANNSSTPNREIHVVVDLALCKQALSSWNRRHTFPWKPAPRQAYSKLCGQVVYLYLWDRSEQMAAHLPEVVRTGRKCFNFQQNSELRFNPFLFLTNKTRKKQLLWKVGARRGEIQTRSSKITSSS